MDRAKLDQAENIAIDTLADLALTAWANADATSETIESMLATAEIRFRAAVTILGIRDEGPGFEGFPVLPHEPEPEEPSSEEQILLRSVTPEPPRDPLPAGPGHGPGLAGT